MNNRRILLFFLFVLSMNAVLAQQDPPLNLSTKAPERPLLFGAASPEKVTCAYSELLRPFTARIGDAIRLNLAPGFFVEGKLVSVTNHSAAVRTVQVTADNFPGAFLTLSRIEEKKGEYSYTATLMSLKHGDMYELKKENNLYVLNKRKTNDFMME